MIVEQVVFLYGLCDKMWCISCWENCVSFLGIAVPCMTCISFHLLYICIVTYVTLDLSNSILQYIKMYIQSLNTGTVMKYLSVWCDKPIILNSPIQYSTVQYSTIQYNTVQYNTIQYSTVQYNTIQYNTIQYNSMVWYNINLIKLIKILDKSALLKTVKTRQLNKTNGSVVRILITV